MAAALPILSLLFIYLYVLLTICPGVFLDALPLFLCVCVHAFVFCLLEVSVITVRGFSAPLIPGP